MTRTTREPERTISFGSLEIVFDERVLTPRPWTAAQSTWAAEILELAPPGPVLELCAGAGHIGLLAISMTSRPLVCVDLNPAACDFARRNAASAGLGDVVEVRQGYLDEVIGPDERFPLVIADPPWVPLADTGRYPEDPFVAINGGADGLDVAWECVETASRHLAPGGTALLQVGTATQADVVGSGLGRYGDLRLTEVRQCVRGVLVRLDRPAA